MNVLELLAKVNVLIFDVDGVLTNGQLTLLDNGEMARTMHIKDGYALQLAIKKGYQIIIISGGNSIAVKNRLQKLGIKELYFDIKNKEILLATIIQNYKYTQPQMMYMGDDIPDVAPMKMVGVACAPADAVQEVLSIAHYISPVAGGWGCVRDVIEKILKLQHNWQDGEVASV